MKIQEMKRRLKAGEDSLELSIQKWQDIVDGTGSDQAELNCALCEKFRIHVEYGQACNGCPVKKTTGKTYCEGSPYFHYADADDQEASDVKLAELAQAELDFLISLRQKP